jgi:hypothetical protein
MRTSHEANRLAEAHLSAAYEKLFPSIKQPVNKNKKINDKEEIIYQLKRNVK